MDRNVAFRKETERLLKKAEDDIYAPVRRNLMQQFVGWGRKVAMLSFSIQIIILFCMWIQRRERISQMHSLLCLSKVKG